ncbi:hypothetical protein GQ42DRAFT_77395 [Ramicandelaber brevisporus]|nr:hypothetical protein GQ42DRAFT_77395 [Ramicandelaber brevisporus]
MHQYLSLGKAWLEATYVYLEPWLWLGAKIWGCFACLFFLIILFLNFRSLPGMYLLRLYYQIWTVVCTGYHNYTWAFSFPPTTTDIMRFRAWPDDCDANLHMNNASYAKMADFARYRWIAAVFGFAIAPWSGIKKFNLANRGVTMVFFKQMPPFTSYRVETRLVSWSKKWTILEHRFVSGPEDTGVATMTSSTTHEKDEAAMAEVRNLGNSGKGRGKKILYAVLTSRLVIKEAFGPKKGKTVSLIEALKRVGQDTTGLEAIVMADEAVDLNTGRPEDPLETHVPDKYVGPGRYMSSALEYIDGCVKRLQDPLHGLQAPESTHDTVN